MANIEHVGHLQFRFGIDSGPHIEARQGDAADDARIGRQSQARPEALFSGDRADDFRDADAQVHDVAFFSSIAARRAQILRLSRGCGGRDWMDLRPSPLSSGR